MGVIDVLKQIGAPEEVVRAVLAALRGAQETEDELSDLGVDVKAVAVVTGAQGEAGALGEADGETGTQPSGDATARDAVADDGDTDEKGGQYFSRKIAALAERASARDKEYLIALSAVVRRAMPEQYGALAALLRTAARGEIAEEVDELASKMEAETRVGYAYPEPEKREGQEQKWQNERDELVATIQALRSELEEVKASLRDRPLVGGPVTRPSSVSVAVSPAAALLEITKS